MARSAAVPAQAREKTALETPIDLSPAGVTEITTALCPLLADVFALYLKTKNLRWDMTGGHFRDYHLLLDEPGDQIFAMTDESAELARKIGGTTLHSIGDHSKHQRLKDNNKESADSAEMLAELRDDSLALTRSLRETHDVSEEHNDISLASLIETWFDEAERRTWFVSPVAGEF